MDDINGVLSIQSASISLIFFINIGHIILALLYTMHKNIHTYLCCFDYVSMLADAKSHVNQRVEQSNKIFVQG